MSTPPPPPPPSSPFGNQPPQQQYSAPPPAYAAPPGYTPYGAPAAATVQPSKGLSKAMVILYALTAGAAALTGIALYSRKSTWDGFVDGSKGIDDLDSADAFLGVSLLLQFALILAAAIVTCLWAKRIANNAKARGAASVNPGLAAGGWFIPIAWFFLGFNELRKSVAGVGGRAPSLALWQGLFIAQSVVLFIINRFAGFSTADDPQEVSDALRNQGIIGLVGAALYIGTTIFAAKAAKEINTAVTGS